MLMWGDSICLYECPPKLLVLSICVHYHSFLDTGWVNLVMPQVLTVPLCPRARTVLLQPWPAARS